MSDVVADADDVLGLVDARANVDVDAPPWQSTVVWEPCDLYTEGGGPEAACARIPVPLDAEAPLGPTIDLFVKRFRPEDGLGLRSLWMLQGGPGASGYVFEKLSEQFANRFKDVDYYMPDHRGTGRSARLGCPEFESPESDGDIAITPAEWPECLEGVLSRDGERLEHYSTTNAANDIGVATAAVHSPDEDVFIYGVSYGTYWAHRCLQLFPDGDGVVDGVVLDSIAPPETSLLRQDEDANAAAEAFFGVCGADAFCASKLGDDPWAKAVALVEKLKAGHCAEIAVAAAPTHVLFRRAFGSLLMDPSLRAFIPTIVQRADRCEAKDIKALKVLMKAITQQGAFGEEQRLWGWIVSNNVLFSEMSEVPPLTPAQLEAIRDGAVASRDVTTIFEPNLTTWPLYPKDDFMGEFAVTSLPLLMLQGGLDPATLVDKVRPLKDVFTGANQTWVEFPQASHTTLVSTPFIEDIGERRSCGMRLLMAFISDPTAEIDAGCVEKIIPIDFETARTDLNKALFGTADAWE